MSHVYDTIQAVRADLNRGLLERQDVIDHALIALLTRQHHLQIGTTGIAKSLLVDALHARILGARRCKIDCNDGTTADDILGPQDMLAYADAGKRQRVHARSAVEADLVFFEEIGRANQYAYNVMLQLLGDTRQVNELGMDHVLNLPLLSAFGASNSNLVGDWRMEAVNNRFALRDIVLPVQERASKLRLLTQPPHPITDIAATMTLDDLRAAQQEIRTVQGTREVLEAVLDLQERLLGESISVTDRLLTWSGPLLKANAWLHGASTLSLEDVQVLAAVWWQTNPEQPVVQRAVYAVSNPLDLRALEVEDNAMDLLKSLPHEDDPDFMNAGESINAQLNHILTTLIADIKASGAREKTKAMGAVARIDAAFTAFTKKWNRRTQMGRVDVAAAFAA